MAIFEEDPLITEPEPSTGVSIVTLPSGAKQVQNFDLNAARTALYDLDYTTADAQEAIARRLARETGFNIDKAFDSGFSTEEIITKLTGIEGAGAAGTVLRGAATEVLPSAAGAAALAETWKRTRPLGGGWAGWGSRGVLSLGAAALASGLTRKVQEDVAEGAGFETDPQLLASDRPWQAAGETLGSFIGAIPGTTALLKNLPEKVSFAPLQLAINSRTGEAAYDATQIPLWRAKYGEGISNALAQLGKTARETPSRLILPEATASFGASVGSGLAEGIAPENPYAGFAGELGGALFSPIRIIANVAPSVGGGLKSLYGRFSGEAREKSVADFIDNTLRDVSEASPTKGGLPEQFRGSGYEGRGALEAAITTNAGLLGLEPLNPDGTPIALTPGQRSGSIPLQMLEAFMAKEDPRFRVGREDAARTAIVAMEKMIVALQTEGQRLGGPQGDAALAAAAELKVGLLEATARAEAGSRINSVYDYFRKVAGEEDALLDGVQEPNADIVSQVADLRVNASTNARQMLENSFGRSRAVESQFYDDLDQTQMVVPTNLFRVLKEAIIESEIQSRGKKFGTFEELNNLFDGGLEQFRKQFLSTEKMDEALALTKKFLNPNLVLLNNLEQRFNTIYERGNQRRMTTVTDALQDPELEDINIYDEAISQGLARITPSETPTTRGLLLTEAGTDDIDRLLTLFEQKSGRTKSGYAFNPTVQGRADRRKYPPIRQSTEVNVRGLSDRVEALKKQGYSVMVDPVDPERPGVRNVSIVLPEGVAALDTQTRRQRKIYEDRVTAARGGFSFALGDAQKNLKAFDELLDSRGVMQQGLTNKQRKDIIGLLKTQKKAEGVFAERQAVAQQIEALLSAPEEAKEVPLRQLRADRSDFLGQRRTVLADPGKPNLARMLDDIQKAIREDLLYSVGYRVDEGGKLVPGDVERVAEAMKTEEGLKQLQAFTYSYLLNQAYTRSFAGSLRALGKKGEQKISPELALQKLFAGNQDAVSVRYGELDDAINFLNRSSEESLVGAEEQAVLGDLERPIFYRDPVTDIKEKVPLSRLMEGEAEDALTWDKSVETFVRAAVLPKTSRLSLQEGYEEVLPSTAYEKGVPYVTPRALTKLLETYGAAMDKNPYLSDLKADLENLPTRETLLEMFKVPLEGLSQKVDLRKPRSTFLNSLQRNERWGQLLNNNPTVTLKNILTSSKAEKPGEQFKKLVNFANSVGDAKDNKAAIVYSAFDIALSKTQMAASEGVPKLNMAAFEDLFFKEGSLPEANNPKGTFIEALVKTGVVDPSFKTRLNKFIKAIDNLNLSQSFGLTGNALEEFLSQTGGITALGARIFGAMLGRSFDTGTIQVPGAMAGAVGNFVTRSPHVLTRQMLIDVLQPQEKDAPLFIPLLRKAQTPKEKFNALNSLGNLFVKVTGIPYLATAGTVSLAEEELQPVADIVAEPVADVTAPVTRGLGSIGGAALSAMNPQTEAPPEVVAPEPAPVNRSQYAAMFPNDIASSLIRQQDVERGIGSLQTGG